MSAYAYCGTFLPPATAKMIYPSSKECICHGDYPKETNQYRSKSEIDVSVTAARLDYIYLTKSTTSSSASSAKNDILSRKRLMNHDMTFEVDDVHPLVDGECPFEDDVMPLLSQSSSITTKLVDVAATKKTPTPLHDDYEEAAIQFDLSISFNGRKYTATRTLPRIIKLYHDLKRELRKRREQIVEARKITSSRCWRRRSFPTRIVQKNIIISSNNMPGTISATNDNEQIPDLPRCDMCLDYNNAAGGSIGSGFSILVALVSSYRPAIEEWLRCVTSIFPPYTSPALSYFLWEPLSKDKNNFKERENSSITLQEGVRSCDYEESQTNKVKKARRRHHMTLPPIIETDNE